jgi:hypothetical protein
MPSAYVTNKPSSQRSSRSARSGPPARRSLPMPCANSAMALDGRKSAAWCACSHGPNTAGTKASRPGASTDTTLVSSRLPLCKVNAPQRCGVAISFQCRRQGQQVVRQVGHFQWIKARAVGNRNNHGAKLAMAADQCGTALLGCRHECRKAGLGLTNLHDVHVDSLCDYVRSFEVGSRPHDKLPVRTRRRTQASKDTGI